MNNFTIYNNNNNLQSQIQSNFQNINTLMTPLIINITDKTTNIDYALTRFDVLNIAIQNDISINITNIPIGTVFYVNQLLQNQGDQVTLIANNNPIPPFVLIAQPSYSMCNIVQGNKIVATNYTQI